jgi:hypothetical protein
MADEFAARVNRIAAQYAREALLASNIEFTESRGLFFNRFTFRKEDEQRARTIMDAAESEHASRDAW